MLVTACKHCHARFRVTPEQLNARQGQVRCGECHEVFNGFESLERFPGDDTGAHLLAARAGRPPEAKPGAGPAELTFGRRMTPAPAPAATARRGPLSALPVDLSDIPDVDDVPDLPLESRAPAGPPPEAAGSAQAEPVPHVPHDEDIGPARIDPAAPGPRIPETFPGSLDADPYVPAPPERPSRAWVFGVVFLFLVLVLQLAYAFRAQLAQQYPVLRPILESACAPLDCTVPWVNDENALKLEDSELLEVPGKPGQIALQARIRNLSASAQEFPHLELTLTDVSGQTAVRRVLRPADYLGRIPVPTDVMAAGSEALVVVRLETGSLRPTGYELLLFYP
ncbi:MAG: zinc-ribbon domain-containing protein [Betaproteobacteria bacterium]|nr:zinc-ribbon domain-containing protein [Betaproteobacteria bacterium]